MIFTVSNNTTQDNSDDINVTKYINAFIFIWESNIFDELSALGKAARAYRTHTRPPRPPHVTMQDYYTVQNMNLKAHRL